MPIDSTYSATKFTKLKHQFKAAFLLIFLLTFFLAPALVSRLPQRPQHPLFQAPVAHAQTLEPDLDLTVFPPTAYLMVIPGSEITHRILLKYDGKIAIKVLPELVDFTTDGLTGTPVLQKPSQLDYVSLKSAKLQLGTPFQLKPNSQIELILKINPPLHAKRGEHPLSLVLTAMPETTVVYDGSSTQTAGAVASNVILSVQDDLDNQGRLQINQLQLPRVVDSFSALEFQLLAENTGRNGVAATGRVTLRHGWSGKKLQEWFIYPDVILAESTRQLRGTALDPDEIDPTTEFEFTPFVYKPPFLIGPYEVTLSLSSANHIQATTQERTQVVIAFPFSVVGLLIFGLILYLTHSGLLGKFVLITE